MKFAVIQTGGKQYRVSVGQSIQVEKLPGEKGSFVQFDRVLLVGEGGEIQTGTPLIEGARVVASVSRQERGPKLLAFRYKSKKRVRVRRGHRQNLTQLYIRDILLNGTSVTAVAQEPEADVTAPADTPDTQEGSVEPSLADESEGAN